MTFLADDTGYLSDWAGITVLRKNLLDVLEGTKHEFSESLRKSDGIKEVCCWELIFAWLDGGCALRLQVLVSANAMELFLLGTLLV